MSLKKIGQVKRDKGFKIFDLIIYGAILITVAVLLIVIFTARDKSPLTGVRIYVKAEVVFEYAFGREPVYTGAAEVEEVENGLTVTVKTADGGVNVIYIDTSKRTVKMKEANCKGKQCLYFHAIDGNDKFIYCSPHGVRVEPYARNLDDPNIIM